MIKLLIGVPLGVAFVIWAVIAFVTFDPAWITGTDEVDRALLFLSWCIGSFCILGATS